MGAAMPYPPMMHAVPSMPVPMPMPMPMATYPMPMEGYPVPPTQQTSYYDGVVRPYEYAAAEMPYEASPYMGGYAAGKNWEEAAYEAGEDGYQAGSGSFGAEESSPRGGLRSSVGKQK